MTSNYTIRYTTHRKIYWNCVSCISNCIKKLFWAHQPKSHKKSEEGYLNTLTQNNTWILITSAVAQWLWARVNTGMQTDLAGVGHLLNLPIFLFTAYFFTAWWTTHWRRHNGPNSPNLPSRRDRLVSNCLLFLSISCVQPECFR